MNNHLLTLQENFFRNLQCQEKSTNTMKNYKTDLDCFNAYLLNLKKKLDINGFNISHVKDYGQFLEEKYSSDNSRRRRLQALRIFFDYLVKVEHIPSNPIRILSPPPKFLDKPRPISPKNVSILWKHLTQKPNSDLIIDQLTALRNQTLFLLIYEAGLKVSDLSMLKMSHLFLKKNPRILVSPRKREPYSVPFSPFSKDIFLNYKILLRKTKKEYTDLDFEEVYFNANHFKILSGGISPRGIELVFKGLGQELNKQFTPKSLRQSCILKWLQDGHKEGLIKEWMGVAPSYSLALFKNYLLGRPTLDYPELSLLQ